MLVRSQPPELRTLVVKRTSCDFPKVEDQVRLLAGVLVGEWACVPKGGCRFGEPCSSGSSPDRSTGRESEHPRSVPVRTRPCEGRRSGSIPDGDTVAEPKAVAGPGCEPGLC